MSRKLLGFLATGLVVQVVSAALPSTIKKCSQGPNFDSCVRDLLESIKPYLAAGSFGPGFNTPSMEPIYDGLLKIASPELTINITNLYTKGATTYQVTTIKPDFQKLQFDIGLLTPRLSYTSKYSLSQKFSGLNVHVRGEGDMSGVFDRVHSKIRVKFGIENRGGVDYVKLKKVQYKLRIDDGKFKISSLSNIGDTRSSELFTEIANNFINSNPDFILRKIEPSLNVALERIITDTFNILLKDVRLDEFN